MGGNRVKSEKQHPSHDPIEMLRNYDKRAQVIPTMTLESKKEHKRKEKREGPPRAPSQYNLFMKTEVVRVKQAEECTKPTLPKRLHAIQGRTAAVISEAGDGLQVQPGAGGKTYSIKRACVEFLHPETAVPGTQGRAPPVV